MNYSPLVSVIIPTFNRAYIIHKAIESVLHQKFKNFYCQTVKNGLNLNNLGKIQKGSKVLAFSPFCSEI
jgi:hypothetical protein